MTFPGTAAVGTHGIGGRVRRRRDAKVGDDGERSTGSGFS